MLRKGSRVRVVEGASYTLLGVLSITFRNSWFPLGSSTEVIAGGTDRKGTAHFPRYP